MGEHFLPVRSEEPPPETRNTLFFSRGISLTARATEEVVTSKMASTPSWSYHLRAMEEPTSGLFWWSAPITSTLKPGFLAMNSSAAICAATTEPGPEMSA